MNEVSSHVKLNKVESSSKNDIKYLLEVGNKQYFVGELIYFIIIQLQAKNTLEKISIDVNLKFKPDALLTGSDIQDIVNNNIKPLGVFEYNYDESKINTSVKAKITLLSAKTINRICSPIKYLFSPLSFFTITLFLVLLNLYFVFWTENPLIKFDYSSGGIITYLLIYPILIIITLIHELGHSAATLKFNVQPKSIGFGFYYLLPVLYTDISGIWRLSKMKKVIINLAGIYMQLLANGLIFITTLFLRNNLITNFLHYIVLANFSIIIINLLPFIKYDAYWIYSDLSGINNLQSKSIKFLKETFSRIIRNENIDIKKIKTSLIVYSIFRLTFFIIIYYFILKAFISEIRDFHVFLEILKYFNFSSLTIFYIIRVLFLYTFGFAVIYSLIKMVLARFLKL